MKYINGTLKDEFGLDTTSKSKPVAGPDDLLLLLVQHWARDAHVFPTEDDRLDLATLLLFQSYTGGRPAEFVHSSKGKASKDPLGEAEKANKNRRRPKRRNKNHTDDRNTTNGLKDNDDSETGGDSSYDDDVLDSNSDSANTDDNDLSDKDTDESADRDSGYSSDGIDVTMTENTDDCFPIQVDKAGQPSWQDCDVDEFDEFGEAVRKYKALCYEDICLWIVKNPQKGERDVLAMEVHLRHHKGVENKPKPYVVFNSVHLNPS